MQKSFSQICQNKGFISSTLYGKNMITVCNIWVIFARKQEGVTSQRVRIKNWQILFNPHYSWPTSCKKNILLFSSFAAADHKGHFRKVLTRILKFGCFSWYHTFIFENNKWNFLMQNLMLNRLAPIPNPKNEKAKSSYALF